MQQPLISGIHHITAIASDPQPNFDFYTQFLGLRLVKKTVNFDDPGSYHFYYGDKTGTPGTILTFFPWPGARRGRQGAGQVAVTSFAVPRNSLAWWARRAETHGIAAVRELQSFGEEVISFPDTDGLQLRLVGSLDEPAKNPPNLESIPAEHAIGGFHSATLHEQDHEQTASLLTDILGFRKIGEDAGRFRFAAGDGGGAAIVDVLHAPGSARGSMGAGTVHHIAWRTPDDAHQTAWRESLVKSNYGVSPVMDRQYFHSIYFREPGGILFEIATDPPGFLIDEPIETLGSALKLPPFYEPMRSEIEEALPPLETGSSVVA